nr:hypothetical protein [Tanacetum cinerariifolium]
KHCDKLSGVRKITSKSIKKLMRTSADGVGCIHLEQLKPQFSRDSKEDGHSSDPSNRHRNTPKRPVDKDVHGTKLESNGKHTSEAYCQTTEAKRGKKTIDASNDVKMEGTGPLVRYAQGKEVKGDVAKFSKVTYVYEKYLAWYAFDF